MPSNRFSARRATSRRPPICISKGKPVILPPPSGPPPWERIECYIEADWEGDEGEDSFSGSADPYYNEARETYYDNSLNGAETWEIEIWCYELTETFDVHLTLVGEEETTAYAEKDAIPLIWGIDQTIEISLTENQNPEGTYNLECSFYLPEP